MNIFGVSDNGEFIINNYGILHNKYFREIFKRDESLEGKEQYKKTIAYKEFAYIYYIADPNSHPNINGYNKKDANLYAIEHSGLDDTYKPDDTVLNAIKFYRKETITTEMELVLNMASVLRKTHSLIGLLDNRIGALLTWAEGDGEADLEKIISLQNKVLELSIKIPTQIDDFNKAIKKLKEKAEASVKMRGTDESIPHSANPNESY